MNALAQIATSHPRPSRHDVRFYADDDILAERVAAFISQSLDQGGAGLVIATGPHRRAIQMRLQARDVLLSEVIKEGRLIFLDAQSSLAHFMVRGLPDIARFNDLIAKTVQEICIRFRAVRAFGEMVDLLAAEGNHAGTIALETLWNELLSSLPSAHLLCAYRLKNFDREAHQESFRDVCKAHASVIPLREHVQERVYGQTLAELQQKALALDSEVRHRRLREKELTDFFENAVIGFHLLDADGTILRANRAELHMLGYSHDQYVGRNIAEFHVDQLVIADILRRLSSGETLHNQQVRLRCRDGTLKYVLIDSNGLWEDGRFIHTRCSTRDISAQVMAEEAAQAKSREIAQSNADLAHFASMASHDMREPLRMITSFLGLLELRAGPTLDDASRRFLGHAKQGAERLASLVTAILEYSQVNTASAQFENFSAWEPLSIATANLALVIQEKKAAITQGVMPYIRADRTQLTQVFQNLIGNAIKYCENRDPVVEISAQENESGWQFTVRDNGIGIAKEHLSDIFTMFQRLHSHDDFAGHGVGLATCKRIIERHHGRIWVESQEGEGSAFHFTIGSGAQ